MRVVLSELGKLVVGLRWCKLAELDLLTPLLLWICVLVFTLCLLLLDLSILPCSSTSYWRVVGSLRNSPAISHSFPSEIEAKVYLAAAHSAMMEPGEKRLTLEDLVSVVDEIEPYVLTLEDVNGGLDGAKEAKVLVVLKRPGGVLLAVPAGFIAGELLEQGNGGADLMFGPSLDITVPGVVLDNGVVSPTGTTVNAVLVDCTAAVLDYLRLPSMFEEIASTFDIDDPYALPAGEAAVAAAMDWIPQVAGLAEFYTAESSALNTPVAKRRATKPGAEKDTPSVAKGGRPKKPTMASLAESMETLTLTNSRFGFSASGALRPSVVGSFEGRLASLSSLAATAKAPPRTTERQQLGLLASPAFKQSEVKELAEEKQLHGDTLAHAVLEQSRALTSLIGQISQSSSDPLADLGSGGGV